MRDRLKASILRWLRVPPEPHPPAGAPGSLRVFRAAPGFWKLRLLIWGFRQISTFVGLVVALLFLRGSLVGWSLGDFPPARQLGPLLLVVEAFGIAAFLAQLPLSLAIARLDFELRWYLVTDRSLRIRSGVWTVEELTMTYANVQELTIHQAPWQRYFGIADLRVRSAGGGGAPANDHSDSVSHAAFFYGVDNATEIRDLIQEHLRHSRDTGLGDPGAPLRSVVAPSAAPEADSVEAARELLAEVKALRGVLSPRRDD